MALPKSMRFLAAITLCIFVYMLLQIFKAPAALRPPESTTKLKTWDHDPQSDRKLQFQCGAVLLHGDGSGL